MLRDDSMVLLHWTRRRFLFASAATLVTACPQSPLIAADVPGSLAAIEAKVGGRGGVFVFNTADGRQLAHRPDERFAMCSTFKWVLAAAIESIHMETSVSTLFN